MQPHKGFNYKAKKYNNKVIKKEMAKNGKNKKRNSFSSPPYDELHFIFIRSLILKAFIWNCYRCTGYTWNDLAKKKEEKYQYAQT